MKIFKRFILMAVVLLPGIISGQVVEITPFGGYQFGGRMNYVEGTLKFEDNANYGIILNVPIERVLSVEVYWSHMDSKVNWDPYKISLNPREFDVSVDYFQVGAMKQADLGTGIVKGFGVLTLGAVYFNIKDPEVSDVWRFAGTLGGGIKIYPTNRIGFRLQGRLLMPMYWGSAGFYCGIGSGGGNCGVGVNATSFLVQGDLTAGVIISIGD
jgi:hypothetical protein